MFDDIVQNTVKDLSSWSATAIVMGPSGEVLKTVNLEVIGIKPPAAPGPLSLSAI